jgi:hypothetical protein
MFPDSLLEDLSARRVGLNDLGFKDQVVVRFEDGAGEHFLGVCVQLVFCVLTLRLL